MEKLTPRTSLTANPGTSEVLEGIHLVAYHWYRMSGINDSVNGFDGFDGFNGFNGFKGSLMHAMQPHVEKNLQHEWDEEYNKTV
ncbi:hypothetical protein MMC06_004288 [Schaereria dolodes]|nr:hypothetical protein [Schaereria dolodes]